MISKWEYSSKYQNGNRIGNPGSPDPIPHTNLVLNDADMRGSILMGFKVNTEDNHYGVTGHSTRK
ncbi:MAG TPA: hypothetical protein DIC22_11170 [Chitinophagaceae bacterium]|nr:hypothetical protein [Chitinophagaceae bacterium]